MAREERGGDKGVERRGEAERASGPIGTSSANQDEGDPAERRRGRRASEQGGGWLVTHAAGC